MEHFVEFEDVCKYYQTGSVKIAAADHLNFYVDKGEFCIIVGPSGAGKTTLLNILGGMDNCDEGNVWLDGRNVSRFSARELTTYRRYDVGFVFQFYNLVHNLTAKENVELAAQICSNPLDSETALDSVGLLERANNFPAQLSGGEQQRIAIARVMLKNSPVVILDEATAFADPDNEVMVQKAFSELAKDRTVIMIAHRLSTVAGADRIYVLKDGKIEEYGKYNELINNGGMFSKMWNDYRHSVDWKVSKEASL